MYNKMGTEAKISSIHVNTWFGAYDKLDTTLRFLREVRNSEEDKAKRRVLFCDDSPMMSFCSA